MICRPDQRPHFYKTDPKAKGKPRENVEFLGFGSAPDFEARFRAAFGGMGRILEGPGVLGFFERRQKIASLQRHYLKAIANNDFGAAGAGVFEERLASLGEKPPKEMPDPCLLPHEDFLKEMGLDTQKGWMTSLPEATSGSPP